MADYSDLDPTALRASLSDGTRLKKSITTDLYTGGTPSAANQVKPSIMYADGTLKESITYADGTLKPSWLIAGSGGGGGDTSLFITEWTVAGADTLTMPTTGTGYNGTVTWKDSLGATVSTGAFTDGDMTPLQAIAVDGVNSPYTCEISGDFPRVYFSGATDTALITDVKQWGTIVWASFANAFIGCSNLDVTATDAPDLSSTNISMLNAFRTCDLSTANFSNWDMSTIVSLSGTFLGSDYNGPIGDGNTVACTNFSYLIFANDSFDQDLGGMVITAATSMTSFASGCDGWSTANYSATINGWKAQVESNSNLPSGISFHGGSSNYNSSAETSHDYLTNPLESNWTIVDGGLV